MSSTALPWAAALLLLWVATPARADDPPVDPAVAADAPAVELPEEGLWVWIARMQGEMLTGPARQAAEELAEELQAERSMGDDVGTPGVPTELYTDPVRATASDPLFLDQVDPSEFDIPLVVNDDVKKWMRYFTGRGRVYYERWLGRASRYRPMMYRELEARKLPRDLVYLSMIESGYNAYANSSAGAVGLWQFMPATGRMYELRVDWWIDDRRDPAKATKAAVAHLGDLHQMFGDWYLAWAAYNAGPGRVRRAIRKAGTKDFWALVRGGHLPIETANYPAKLLAAAIIGKHPERYGFTGVTAQPELVFDEVEVSGSVDLDVLAKAAGISRAELGALNPGLRRWATPADGYALRVPSGTGKTFAAELAKIPKSQRVSFVQHRVASGETLSTIAVRYGVTVPEMQKVNNLANADRIYVGMNLIIPVEPGSPALASAPAPVKASSTHQVEAGDSLSTIARRYGTTVAQLQTWNDLEGTVIQPGQELVLSAPPPGERPLSTRVAHAVQKGDSLSGIAVRYGVTVVDLKRWNGLTSTTIFAGQVLAVHVPDRRWKTHVVARGESLSVIAQRNECTVRDLMDWNELQTATLQPGQKLRIRQ